ncbi:putative MFS family arabinose efflux permease [Pseudonocardia sediminis]|uniref:Putative MFS family arabinose efflux permease n=1 Tax=Pseudonocardia sediminis TaxID=1397368 RepID=A0A4Q7USP9_PSEST|nr:MFS transporter [Pseudonocardia sediminis]RZT83791.1 putative MFS family arabinose efflux permease [Pseudonocardia sediminis]
MRGRPFRFLLLATALGFGGYALLLPVVPLWVSRGGAGEFGAGLSTGVLMAVTVATQLGVPALLRRVGHRVVLCSGMVLLGAPAPLLALSADLGPVLAVSVVRGVGFGLLTVAGSALVAELVDPSEHGRASAWFGYAVGLPQLVFLPAGVAVADVLGFAGVFVAAGVGPVSAAVVVLFVRGPGTGRAPARVARPSVPGRTLSAAPVLAMLACSTAQGGIITFGPLLAPGATVAVPLALFLTALGALAGRGVAGEITDRRGRAGALLPVGTVLAAAGMALVVLSGGGSVLLVAGATVVGTGFGLVQNDAMVALFAAAGPQRYGTASAAWNVAYDAGTGLGASGLGAIAEPFGFAAAFGVSAVFLLVLTPVVRRRSGDPG